jgi:hypothetical protein
VATFISKSKNIIFPFLFYNIGEQEGRTDPAESGEQGLVLVGRGKWWEIRVRG